MAEAVESPPWEKYGAQAGQKPWERYKAAGSTVAAVPQQPAQAGAAGLLSRMRDMLQTKAAPAMEQATRGVVQGIGDIGYGAAQLARRVPDPTGFLPRPASVGRIEQQGTQDIDRAVQAREQTYQASPGVQQHPTASAAGRLIGNIAATAPLGVAGGAIARGGGLATRLGTAAGTGAAAAAMEPAKPEGFGTKKLQQMAYGAGGGAAGGALGEVVSSTLGKAIAGNTPAAIDSALTKAYRRAVKPSRLPPGQQDAPGLESQDRRILTAVDKILEQKPSLKLTDASGGQVTGQAPKTLRQFLEATDQTKTAVFRKYSDQAKVAGQQGAMVDLTPAVTELRRVAATPAVVDFHPNLAKDANTLADNMAARGAYSAEEAQDVIQNLNKTLAGFYRNPTNESVTHASLLAPVARTLRQGLDQAITTYQGPGYQQLRNEYGAIASVEKDIVAAVQREMNKKPGGIAAMFSDLVASEEAIRGIFTFDPRAIARAGSIKAAQLAMRYVNSPNRAIDRLFSRREATSKGASPLRSALGTSMATPYPSMGFSIAGGNLSAPTPVRDYLKDRDQQIQLPSGVTVSR